MTILAEQLNEKINIYNESYTKKYNYYDLIYLILSDYKDLDTLIEICNRLNHDLRNCANLAYNEIKNRKGVTKNGTFIKDSTPTDYIID